MQALRYITKKKRQCQLCSLLFLLSSCSSLEWIIELDRTESIKKNVSFGREKRNSLLFFIQNVYDEFVGVNKSSISKYSAPSKMYLNSLIKRDERGDDLKLDFNFYLWRVDEPFYFVSPDRDVIFTRGFVDRFLQTEDILKVVLIECYLRNKYSVYNFKDSYPTGFKTISDLSSLLQVGLKDKGLLNKWVYTQLKKNKIDTNSILYWMQEKIRADMGAYYIASNRSESLKEEQYIKEYLLQQGIYNEEEEFNLQSKKFFKFKREN